jgi:hypothetical protein
MTGRTRARLRIALAVGGLATLVVRVMPHGRVHAAEPVAGDPPLCQQALMEHPEEAPLAALASAEQDAAQRAAHAGREAAKILRKQIGAGPEGGLSATTAADALLRHQAEARREGKVLCHCRQRRGDPDRSDCEFLYPERLQ